VRDLVRRSVTTVRNIAKGEAITASDIALLRPGTGIPPAQFDAAIGRRAARDIAADETLHWPDLT
jgi:N,N'-diacetyllegionaminate synthase